MGKWTVLFRKIVVDDNIYYQLYDIVENFQKTDDFGDYDHRLEKSFVYVDIGEKDVELYRNVRLMVYKEDNGFSQITDANEIREAFLGFQKVFPDLEGKVLKISGLRDVNDVFDDICSSVFAQKEAVADLLDTIMRNQEFLTSDVSDDFKLKLKNNIMLYGPMGNGKNSILDALKKYIDIPCADITLSLDVDKNAENILDQLVKQCGSNIEAIENSLILVRDNFNELSQMMGTTDLDPFYPLRQLTHCAKVYFGQERHKVDFRKMTFITAVSTSLNDDMVFEHMIEDIVKLANVQQTIYVKELNKHEKKDILLSSPLSYLKCYERILESQGRKLILEDGFLEYLIASASKIESGLNIVNDFIDDLVKETWYDDEEAVRLTKADLSDMLGDVTEELAPKNKSISNDFNLMTSKKELKLDDLLSLIKKIVCSQDEHVRRILFTVLKNQKAAHDRSLDNPKRYIKNILVRGESGSGKTLIMTEIAKLLKLPIYIADATSYSETGYVGNSVTDMLVNLYHEANDNLDNAEKGILVIDEIDKKVGGTDGRADISRGAVLNSLLKIIEGAVIPIEIERGINKKTIMFDTSRLTVVCSGAFEGLEEIRDQRLRKRKKSIGFTMESNEEVVDKNIIDVDYVNYGMIRQFMARLGVIVNLNNLAVNDLRYIMINSSASELVVQKKLFELDQVELVYEDDFYDELSKVAFSKKIGARGIEKAFQDVLTNIKIDSIDASQYEKIIFTKECIVDPTKIVLVPRQVKGLSKVKKR